MCTRYQQQQHQIQLTFLLTKIIGNNQQEKMIKYHHYDQPTCFGHDIDHRTSHQILNTLLLNFFAVMTTLTSSLKKKKDPLSSINYEGFEFLLQKKLQLCR